MQDILARMMGTILDTAVMQSDGVYVVETHRSTYFITAVKNDDGWAILDYTSKPHL